MPSAPHGQAHLTPHATRLGGNFRPQLSTQRVLQHAGVHGRHLYIGMCRRRRGNDSVAVRGA
eukprot:CAMPEP_0119279556 /NCGR_PEP_ID=MMETSP1329-20130426/21033_1 /TAXON_ID=114041 /ORGANISM="Genus nov. species nov., Strain RCC1024" /LENGTH=61 /DNA_ID=CAMNT_0007280105 /DNA_START=607 /DNA_END=788 /DNA_ORIENTATION=+